MNINAKNSQTHFNFFFLSFKFFNKDRVSVYFFLSASGSNMAGHNTVIDPVFI